ncbi:4'-phosphopantetheinyl transferase superfamily protein [uncultured Flavobacterium sp.]|uniref:4'-phosphopantetheinyl transferase family protein n=1 Tax=uncultured Flavobacterium sp. TaxID=165435 RepID=UPI0030ED75FA|tara:strand:- start:800 stop:1447 length:648 start_codon:yes stop_codon:yes gene_type:complete
MPLHKVIYLSNNTKLYLWKITEDLDTLSKDTKLKDSSIARLESMKSESHKKGFLAVRKLLQHIDYNDFDLYYDAFGKPNLKPQGCSIKDMHISISHSHDFSAIAISERNIGIDIEILKEKIIRIAPKFMDISHIENLNVKEQIEKATVIWGIKESIFKIKNEPGISFPKHIFEDNFIFEDKVATAKLKFNNKVEKFTIEFDSYDGYMFVCAFENN